MKKTTFTLLSSLALCSSLFASELSKEVKNNSLLVYNSNIALVHEERELRIDKRDNRIVYEGIASTVSTDSVNVELPKSISLLSQQYRFDKLTQAKLLNAYINKKVEVRLLKNRNEFKIISATLLSVNGAKAIVRTDGYKILTVMSIDIIVDEIPEELIIKPSLVWNVQVNQDIKTNMKIDYLISNINFKSDYILNIDKNIATLTGWITIENRSGKSFKNTELSLLAGDINRAYRATPQYRKSKNIMLQSSDAMEVKEISHEGYHFYKIPFKVNIANNEKSQIKFLTKNTLKIEREYFTKLSNPLYSRGERKYAVSQYIRLQKLDTALPKGIVRTYSKLNKQTILLGETNLSHTPKNTPIKFKIGENFDTKITQRVVSREDDNYIYRVDVEYEIKNDSDTSKLLKLHIPFNRNRGSQVETKEKYKFTQGNIIEFQLEVDANSIKKFKIHFESKK